MVLISTPEEQAEAEAEEQVEASAETEEEAENQIVQEEALDNLSDAMEEMFSTCNLNVPGCTRSCNSRPKERRADARDALKEARNNIKTGEGGVRKLLGRLVKLDGRATWNQFGLAADLAFFIAKFGMTHTDYSGQEYCELRNTKHKDACGKISREEKLAYFETFRDLLTDACTAVDGTWSDYTSGNGQFKDEGSYGDWTLGQCK